jgi:hypothetical protein
MAASGAYAGMKSQQLTHEARRDHLVAVDLRRF